MTEPTQNEGRTPVERIVAVLDSNVFIDLYSMHNLVRAEAKEYETREARARDALLLGICLHEMGAMTYSVREPIDVVERLVPPNSGGTEELYVKSFLYFVSPKVLSRWSAGCDTDHQPRGNAADRFLTRQAAENGKPLITLDAKMGERARKEGVSVFTPREFCNGRMDRNAAAQRFLRRFRAEWPAFARGQQQPAHWARVLDDLFGLYRWLLLGRAS